MQERAEAMLTLVTLCFQAWPRWSTLSNEDLPESLPESLMILTSEKCLLTYESR